MVEKITVSVPTQYASEGIFLRPIAVSLPAPPFPMTVTYNDRDETRPRSAPIRAETLTAIDKKWLRGVARVK